MPHRLAVTGGLATFLAGDAMCELRSISGELAASGDAAVGEFTLARGERASFALSVGKPGPVWNEGEIEVLFDETVSFWREWIAQSRYRGRWREMVDRSAITLKLLTYLPTGAVVRHRPRACPSTSAARATGTIATAGCATRRSRCSRSSAWASVTRR